MRTILPSPDAMCRCGHAASVHSHAKSCTAYVNVDKLSYCKCEFFREAGSSISMQGEEAVKGKKNKKEKATTAPPLAEFVDKPVPIFIEVGGKEREATVLSSGMVKYKGEEFKTPSAAAQVIAKECGEKKPIRNAWVRFKFNKDGERVPLDRIRGTKAKLKVVPKKKKVAKAAKKAKSKKVAASSGTKTAEVAA